MYLSDKNAKIGLNVGLVFKNMLPAHIKFYNKLSSTEKTQDGVLVDIIDIVPVIDELDTMSNWAKHLRNLYCEDSKIDEYISGTGKTKSEYLNSLVFPGKSFIISGDFAETLVADYIEFILNYYVPRNKFLHKGANRNTSPMGIDVIGFKIQNIDLPNIVDEMVTCEVKASLVGRKKKTLQNAIDDSIKDVSLRNAESLNAIKRRLIDGNNMEDAKKVERFQNPDDNPYRLITSAIAVHSNHNWDNVVITKSNCNDHPNKGNLYLFVIKGDCLMDLAKKLYTIACDEA